MYRRIFTLSAALATIAGLSVSVPVFAALDTDELPAELMQNLDLNGDGIVGPQEQARAERLRARIDLNHDGAISEQERERARLAFEYADASSDTQLSAQERHRNRYMYNQADVNDDVRIGQYELQHAYELRDSAISSGHQRR